MDISKFLIPFADAYMQRNTSYLGTGPLVETEIFFDTPDLEIASSDYLYAFSARTPLIFLIEGIHQTLSVDAGQGATPCRTKKQL